MLLRFAVSNHLSIRDRQELSLVASSPSGAVLPAIVLYGANASGNSNVVDALRTMRETVLRSHRSGEPAAGVADGQPYRLSHLHRRTRLSWDMLPQSPPGELMGEQPYVVPPPPPGGSAHQQAGIHLRHQEAGSNVPGLI